MSTLRRFHSCAALAAAVILSLAGVAAADTITLYATDDATMWKANPTSNFGNEPNLSVMSLSFNEHRSLLKFDLSGIPSGGTINSATLTLYSDVSQEYNANGANPYNIAMDVFRVTNDWLESPVTWNNRLAATPWATGGSDYVGTTQVQDVNQYARATDNPTANDVPVSWTVTSLVNQWYQGTYTNDGLLIRSYYVPGYYDTFQANHLYFRSSEYAGTASDPTLTVNYTVPEPAMMALLAIGGIVLIRRRK